MRVEQVHGRWLLCGHILPVRKLKPGQVWARADGSNDTVTIINVEDDWVDFQRGPFEFSKQAFAFQCRYCLVLDGPELPKELLT